MHVVSLKVPLPLFGALKHFKTLLAFYLGFEEYGIKKMVLIVPKYRSHETDHFNYF